jgi:sodium-dependent dicarboxylate transporter 2/3/5
MTMILKHRGFQLCMAILLGAAVLMLPRPDGTTFKIVGDIDRSFFQKVSDRFEILSDADSDSRYLYRSRHGRQPSGAVGHYLKQQASSHPNNEIEVVHQDGLSPKAQRFLAYWRC